MASDAKAPNVPPRYVGAGLMVAALCAVYVRYAFFPLDLGLSSISNAFITGPIAGLGVLGFTFYRKGRPSPAGHQVAAAAVGAALVFAVGLAIRPASPTEMELVPVSGPGFSISLPQWPREGEAVDAASGSLRAVPPTGPRGRFVELKWSVSDLATDADLAAGLGSFAQVGERVPATVAGAQTTTLTFGIQKSEKKAAVTQWLCPEQPRAFTLFTFLSLELEELLAVHDRVLASFHCEHLDASSIQLVFPKFEGEGLERMEVASAVTWAHPDGSGYTFTAGSSEKLVTTLSARDELRRGIISGIGLRPAANAFADPPRMEGADGRPVWSGQITDPESGDSFEMLLTVFACPGGQEFIGMYSPADVVPEDAWARLASAECP